tara:strand:- start:24 stop:203 length:180 start_codon:yes stop_codon:yes gene_type:complete
MKSITSPANFRKVTIFNLNLNGKKDYILAKKTLERKATQQNILVAWTRSLSRLNQRPDR